MKHLREITTVLRPNAEGQGVFHRAGEKAAANLFYSSYESIWGKKKQCPFLIKGREQRSPQGFCYGVVASLGGQLFSFHFVKIDIRALDLK